MKLSNFDWTDKTSVRWFIIGPQGHEGPYDFSAVSEKFSHRSYKEAFLWAEGLVHKYEFSFVEYQFGLHEKINKLETFKLSSFDFQMPLDKSKNDNSNDAIDENKPTGCRPSSDLNESQINNLNNKIKNNRVKKVLIFLLLLSSAILWKYQYEQRFDFIPPEKMTLSAIENVKRDFQFEGWEKEISFKSYIAPDMTEIWLLTPSFHECEVDLSFRSLDNKLLSNQKTEIAFTSSGKLNQHLVTLSHFDFLKGNRIIPGMYEVEILGNQCKWGSLWSKMGNLFRSPALSFSSKMTLVLYSGGELAFHLALAKVMKKRLDLETKKIKKDILFFQDVIVKYQTLKAISQQIEEKFIFLIKSRADLSLLKLKDLSIDFSRNQSHFLTTFLEENERYFISLSKNLPIQLKENGDVLKQMTKLIGKISMDNLDLLSSQVQNKKFSRTFIEKKIKSSFEQIYQNIDAKISEVSLQRDFEEKKVSL
jgi:23S rRNA A1618 N6-methylase RlmF